MADIVAAISRIHGKSLSVI